MDITHSLSLMKENQNIEFKQSWRDEYLQYICGFANAQVFYLAGLIEQWGRGYEKIHDAFVREHLIQPTFEQARGGILVTIPREKFIAINSGKPVGAEVSTTQDSQTIETGGQTGGQTIEKVFDLIKENPNITRAQISQILGISSSAIQKHIDTLKKSRIRRVGGDFGGHWEIVS